MDIGYLANEDDVAVMESQLWMFSHVDSSPVQLQLRLVLWVEVDVEALVQDAVNVGRVCPMEEQHFPHFLLSVHLVSLLERQFLGIVVLQCIGVADVLDGLD